MNTPDIIKEFREKFCRKNAQTGEYEPRWFVKDAIKYREIEDALLKALADRDTEIKNLIVKEINIARSEGEKTSRLTSLYNKL